MLFKSQYGVKNKKTENWFKKRNTIGSYIFYISFNLIYVKLKCWNAKEIMLWHSFIYIYIFLILNLHLCHSYTIKRNSLYLPEDEIIFFHKFLILSISQLFRTITTLKTVFKLFGITLMCRHKLFLSLPSAKTYLYIIIFSYY